VDVEFCAGLHIVMEPEGAPETIVVNGVTMKAPQPNCTANVRVGSGGWRTMKRRKDEPLAEFVQRCEEAALAALDGQPEAAPAAAPGKPGDGRVLRKRVVSEVCSGQVEAPVVLCRWCRLPEAAHGGANKCPSRKYPAISKPLECAAGSEADRDYHRRYTAASRELQRTADAELATAVARGLPCPNLPATTQGALPAVPPGASLKEEGTVPPMPTGAFVKEEGVLVPLMPPDAFVKVEVVVKEEEGPTFPAVPPGASLKEEGTVPPMPPVTFVKEEGVVPPMPPDAFVKAEVVVKEEERSDSRPKRQRAK
jgi:hypothetical protein